MSAGPEAEAPLVDVAQLAAADLESQLNSEFVVDLNYCGIAADATPVHRNDVYPAGASLTLKLVEVTIRQPLSPDLRQDPCTLLFLGSHDVPLCNDVHVLQHKSLGRIPLFLSPVNVSPGIQVTQHPEGRFYESVLN